MNIQIFGKAKCFDTKKAERYFKERRIKYQFVDVIKFGMSRGELNSVKNAVGLDAMIDEKDEDYPLVQYLASNEAKLDKLYEIPYLIKLQSSETANRPLWVIALMSGKHGNKKRRHMPPFLYLHIDHNIKAPSYKRGCSKIR